MHFVMIEKKTVEIGVSIGVMITSFSRAFEMDMYSILRLLESGQYFSAKVNDLEFAFLTLHIPHKIL